MSTDDLKIIGLCPVTGLPMRTKENWKYETNNYYIHPYVVAEALIIVNSKGIPDHNSIQAGIDLFDKISSSFPQTKNFALISDQQNVKAVPPDARRMYINYIKNNKKISTIIFYNVNRSIYISLKLGRALIKKTHIKLYVTKSYKESIFKAFESLSLETNETDFKDFIKYSLKNKKDKLVSNFKNSISNIKLIKGKKIFNNEDLEMLNIFLLNIDWNDYNTTFDISKFEDTPFKTIYKAIIFIKSELDNLIQERDKQEKELKELNINLEKIVKKRTKELEDINKDLREEVVVRKKVEKQLIRAKELAEDANKAKSLFLANISHELKTPMNSILGYSSLGIEKINQIDRPKGQTYFKKINKSGKRLLKLLEDLIDSAKSESLEIKYEFNETDLLEILKLAVNDIEYKAKTKKLSIVLEYDEDETYILNADSKRIRQVVDNIIINAIKFTKTSTTINICLFKRDDVFLVKVKDQGIGLDSRDSLRIFDSFYQSPKSQNNTNRGAGLGLAISKKIILAHNGKIWAHNRTDGVEGAIFIFELPIL